MKEFEFIKGIVEHYHAARSLTIPQPNLRRGRSHAISSIVEDLFGAFIASKYSDHEFLVDQPITFQIEGKSKTLYPDLVMIKDGMIKHMFDVKMDLGWKRQEIMYETCPGWKMQEFAQEKCAGRKSQEIR